MNTLPLCSKCPLGSTRREWIQRLALSSAVYAGLSERWFVTSAHATGDIHEHLQINLTAFPSLALDGGSAIITFDGGATKILINRESASQFYAMSPTCTHAGCRVNPYNSGTNTTDCPCHGSQFNLQGQVVQGPAGSNLQPYATHFEAASTLHIEVPGFIHRLDEIAVESTAPGTLRMRLTFPTLAGGEYHIRYSASLSNASFAIIPFALSPTGPAEETFISGTGDSVTVFVDASTSAGFYTLDLIVYQEA